MQFDEAFLIQLGDLNLAFEYPSGERRLSFQRHAQDPHGWREVCARKLAELLNARQPPPCEVRVLRTARVGGVEMLALLMRVDATLTIPAYLLVPDRPHDPASAVMAIHGHGEVEPCIGLRDDYHHQFALVLAQAGHTVLCPELRGFGTLQNLAAGLPGHRLDYWDWGSHMAYSLVTDAFQHGRTLIGDTVEDLLRWEDWLARDRSIKRVHVAGISYGGDLALCYPVFSARVDRIFASGTLGSFSTIFSRCYNAPAHCVPNVLAWMDRTDIAGLNVPRPLALHYGALDVPGDGNYSASYNETVEPSLRELREIYTAFGATDQVRLIVTLGKGHEMDNEALLAFMAEGTRD
jgi:dienelactone hydrolase